VSLNLPLSALPDGPIRDALKAILDEHLANPALSGQMVPRTYRFEGAVTQMKVPHGLAFSPLDCVLLRKTGAGSLTIHYDLFDNVNVVLSTTGPCVVRLLLGTYGS
jgi:hypothetical protein